jgi:hypothetical protein
MTIASHVIKDIGYVARDGIAITTVRSAIGEERGYTLKVARFAALGFVIPDFHVHVFDLAVGHDIDGLIALSFLRRFDYHASTGGSGRTSDLNLVADPIAAQLEAALALRRSGADPKALRRAPRRSEELLDE